MRAVVPVSEDIESAGRATLDFGALGNPELENKALSMFDLLRERYPSATSVVYDKYSNALLANHRKLEMEPWAELSGEPGMGELRGAVSMLHREMCDRLIVDAEHSRILSSLSPFGLLASHTSKISIATELISPAMVALAEEVNALKAGSMPTGAFNQELEAMQRRTEEAMMKMDSMMRSVEEARASNAAVALDQERALIADHLARSDAENRSSNAGTHEAVMSAVERLQKQRDEDVRTAQRAMHEMSATQMKEQGNIMEEMKHLKKENLNICAERDGLMQETAALKQKTILDAEEARVRENFYSEHVRELKTQQGEMRHEMARMGGEFERLNKMMIEQHAAMNEMANKHAIDNTSRSVVEERTQARVEQVLLAVESAHRHSEGVRGEVETLKVDMQRQGKEIRSQVEALSTRVETHREGLAGSIDSVRKQVVDARSRGDGQCDGMKKEIDDVKAESDDFRAEVARLQQDTVATLEDRLRLGEVRHEGQLREAIAPVEASIRDEVTAREAQAWALEQGVQHCQEATERGVAEVMEEVKHLLARTVQVEVAAREAEVLPDRIHTLEERASLVEKQAREIAIGQDELADHLQADLVNIQGVVDNLVTTNANLAEERRAATEQRLLGQLELIPPELGMLRGHVDHQCADVREYLLGVIDARQRDAAAAFTSRIEDFKRDTITEVEMRTDAVQASVAPEFNKFRRDILDEAEGITTGMLQERIEDMKEEEKRHTKAVSRLIENRHQMLSQEMRTMKREMITEMEAVSRGKGMGKENVSP